LSKGSGAISIQTTRDHYKVGEQILILGNTATVNVLLDIMITDTNGQIIKKVETFSNKFGVFKIDNFRIPLDGIKGTWTINAKSGGNFMESNFDVIDDSEKLMLKINKTNYNNNEIMSIEGDGARSSSTITIKIMNSGDNIIQTLNITAKNNGEFATVWQIPADLELGEYDILADDGKTNAAIKFTIN
jgi:uncharacterized protein YfaS (alpha-2-macroglobulin family)